jgi:hypothetical protein
VRFLASFVHPKDFVSLAIGTLLGGLGVSAAVCYALAVCLYFLAWAVGVWGRLLAERCWGHKIYFGSFDLPFSASREFVVRPASMCSTPSSAAAGWVASHSVGVRGAFCGVIRLAVRGVFPLPA